MPPPEPLVPAGPPPAELPLMVTPSSVRLPIFLIPPPAWVAELPLMTMSRIATIPPARMRTPPPSSDRPLFTVRPEIVTVLGMISKTRKSAVPAAELRWTVNWLAPGPAMVRFVVITSSPLLNAITPLTAKVTVSPGAAVAIASRSEPGPLSSVVVTTAADANGERSSAAMTKANGIVLFIFRLPFLVLVCALRRNDSFFDDAVWLFDSPCSSTSKQMTDNP